MRNLVVFIALLATVQGQEDFPFLPKPIRGIITKNFMVFRKHFHEAIGPVGTSKDHLKAAMRQQKVQEVIKETMEFPCDLSLGRSKEVPKSVHRIRPGDIDVIGALGDSLTAGFGVTATNIAEVLKENRGLVALIGGQGTWREYLTLPNILKLYNPKLFGFSLGDALSFEWPAQFNPAEGGAMTHDMPFMARELIKRITNDSRVDVKNHWKLISILIGGNDHCSDMCYYDEKKYLINRRRNLIKTLDLLRDNLPRTLVNLILSPNPSDILPYIKGHSRCKIPHILECPCIMGKKASYRRPYYRKKILESIEIEIEVGNMKRYEREDFAVVVQPLFLNMTIPEMPDGTTDISYFSIDCFHISQKANARGANAIWNNMMEPVGEKSTDWKKEYELFKCPTVDRPYIFTKRNSLT